MKMHFVAYTKRTRAETLRLERQPRDGLPALMMADQKKAVTPTKNEPPPIKKKGSYIIAQVKRNEKEQTARKLRQQLEII